MDNKFSIKIICIILLIIGINYAYKYRAKVIEKLSFKDMFNSKEDHSARPRYEDYDVTWDMTFNTVGSYRYDRNGKVIYIEKGRD